MKTVCITKLPVASNLKQFASQSCIEKLLNQINLMMSEQQKRKRKTLSLEIKIQVLEMLESGMKTCEICKQMNMHEATVRTISKKKKDPRKCSFNINHCQEVSKQMQRYGA